MPLLRAPVPVLALLLLGACSKGQVEPTDPGGGGKVCTEIGCIGGLRIELQPSSGWPAGDYTFAFALDGVPVTCKGALPLRACDAGPSLTCDVPDRVQIGESGCALPPEQHGFADIQIPSSPAAVQLEIRRGEETIYAGDITPTYVESRPNGPGCEPVCRGATAQVAIQ
ncbi:hypothetical protein [Nannocystis punicea]|uniref:Uncharacterized protein n=1 Tax=Nannocystis punicea TaxID=2995304 RepID=A0ABY7HGD0_9BACT|nr:hypothetical protein [Nannocystis poenicansa]WAS97959.1 hypothetical protein O0S08_17605 [Nannocystis poenicansa]